MGQGSILQCRKCGLYLEACLGVGAYDVIIRQEIRRDMRNGVYGEVIKEASRRLKAIHQERALFACDHCGDLVVDNVIDLCEPTINCEHPRHFVMDYQLGDTYRVVHSVEPKCAKCNNPLRIIKQRPLSNLKCPRCKVKLFVLEDVIDWD